MTDEATGKARKTRSDKGQKREQVYMTTVMRGGSIIVVGNGNNAQAAMDEAAGQILLGETACTWKRVGNPRVAQMRLM